MKSENVPRYEGARRQQTEILAGRGRLAAGRTNAEWGRRAQSQEAGDRVSGMRSGKRRQAKAQRCSGESEMSEPHAVYGMRGRLARARSWQLTDRVRGVCGAHGFCERWKQIELPGPVKNGDASGEPRTENWLDKRRGKLAGE
jgi:hypothetical protein